MGWMIVDLCCLYDMCTVKRRFGAGSSYGIYKEYLGTAYGLLIVSCTHTPLEIWAIGSTRA
jgi:hypothetical protein